ncbi:MAG: hypothetical protein AAF848_02615 [Pseudomonadota bacterium]
MKKLTCVLALLAAPVMAQDFSAESTAKEWGLYGESKAFFAATVVDPLCELTGDCPDNCGDGRRQLALLRTADNVMVFPLKNSQPAFTGAANEMLPFCGQAVDVDGLLMTNEELGAQNIYLIQMIRAEGTEEWTKANKWTKDWAAAHPEAAGKGPWFRRDPRVKAEIEREGWLGLGAEIDAAFLEEWFE